MHISSIELSNFRNYEHALIDFSEGINLFYGKNAQGKTNILEAVSLAATTRSHKGSKDRDMVRHTQEESHIRMFIKKNTGEHRLDLHLKKNGKKGIALDMVPVKRAGDIYGLLNIVVFSPEDLTMIKSGPKARRRFLNQELCQTDRLYFSNLARYQKCLLKRASFLKTGDVEKFPEELDAWDMQLVFLGKQIINSRKKFISEISPIVNSINKKISGGSEEIELIYEPNVTEEDFEKTLAATRARDIRMRENHVGPHRDDFSVMINGKDARLFGSQGQQRSAALSLKLAEIEILKEKTGEVPVLLLDDVLSELDTDRQQMLFKGISGGQTLLTCTGLFDIERVNLCADRVFYVEEGTVTVKQQQEDLHV